MSCVIYSLNSLPEAAAMESYVYTTTLLVAVIVLGFCSPENTYHIKPLSNGTCDNAQPCITLSDFAQRNSTPTKRTTLKFVPGEHMLTSNISVANRNSYTLIGLGKGIKNEKVESSVRRMLVLHFPICNT